MKFLQSQEIHEMGNILNDMMGMKSEKSRTMIYFFNKDILRKKGGNLSINWCKKRNNQIESISIQLLFFLNYETIGEKIADWLYLILRIVLGEIMVLLCILRVLIF